MSQDASHKTDQDSRYSLGGQVGFNLRRASQRHVAIFTKHVEGLTPTQFAALAMLVEQGTLSQNKLGRMTAMDSATIKGVVERLRTKGYVRSKPDENDMRLRLVELTDEGREKFDVALPQALAARTETLEGLSDEQVSLLESLLLKVV